MGLEAVAAARTDWPQHLVALLPVLPTGVCDDAVDRLLKAGHPVAEIREVVQKVISLPIESFDALLWLWDGPKRSEILEGVSPVTVLTRILRALDDCRRDDRVPRPLAKKLANRARSVLGARRYERFIDLVKTIDRGMAIALRSQLAPLENLGRSVPEDMINILSRAFPLRDQQPTVPPWQREDVLYVTQQGMARKQAEIDHHVNVKMRDNARAIGAAAEHGDLSENSEYKFALEERDLLRARLGQMNSEMASAKVLTPADVPLDHVGIGTKVIFRSVEDDAPYEMTFVGPWEADHTKGWFNYLAPMAQGILGKRVGDLVDFGHGEVSGQYRIAEIQNGIEQIEMKAFESHDYTPAPRPDHAHT
jgi:transcription elongation factor GreA